MDAYSEFFFVVPSQLGTATSGAEQDKWKRHKWGGWVVGCMICGVESGGRCERVKAEERILVAWWFVTRWTGRTVRRR